MGILPPLTAFTVFLAIACVGFLFLLISLVFGGIFDHFEWGADAGFDHGGPGFFSGRVIAVFITSFGSFGAIATHYGISPLPASGIGFGGGVVLRWPDLPVCTFSVQPAGKLRGARRRSRRPVRARGRRDPGLGDRAGALPDRGGTRGQDRPDARRRVRARTRDGRDRRDSWGDGDRETRQLTTETRGFRPRIARSARITAGITTEYTDSRRDHHGVRGVHGFTAGITTGYTEYTDSRRDHHGIHGYTDSPQGSPRITRSTRIHGRDHHGLHGYTDSPQGSPRSTRMYTDSRQGSPRITRNTRIYGGDHHGVHGFTAGITTDTRIHRRDHHGLHGLDCGLPRSTRIPHATAWEARTEIHHLDCQRSSGLTRFTHIRRL